MATLIPENFETVVPSEADAVLAREASRLLATHKLGQRASVRRSLDRLGFSSASSSGGSVASTVGGIDSGSAPPDGPRRDGW